MLALAFMLIDFAMRGADKLLTFSNKRGERLVVARRVEQLHGGFSFRASARLDPLPEVAHGGGRDEPELE